MTLSFEAVASLASAAQKTGWKDEELFLVSLTEMEYFLGIVRGYHKVTPIKHKLACGEVWRERDELYYNGKKIELFRSRNQKRSQAGQDHPWVVLREAQKSGRIPVPLEVGTFMANEHLNLIPTCWGGSVIFAPPSFQECHSREEAAAKNPDVVILNKFVNYWATIETSLDYRWLWHWNTQLAVIKVDKI